MVGPPFTWFGGKANMAKDILGLLYEPHETYVEVFGGCGAVLLAKKPNPRILEVYNDLDGGLVDFYRVMREGGERLEELLRLLRHTPFSREEYYYCRETWTDVPKGELERVRRWYVVAAQSFSGKFGRSWTHGVTTPTNVNKWSRIIDERIPEVAERFRCVQVENKDWYEVVQKYDRPETMFYLDPPYVWETRTTGEGGRYDHDFETEDHIKLVDTMLNIKGKALISGYAHSIYDPLEEAGWSTKTYEIPLSTPAKKEHEEREVRTEKMWYNYQSIHDLQIGLFTE
jgi:DNA adenine methylase